MSSTWTTGGLHLHQFGIVAAKEKCEPALPLRRDLRTALTDSAFYLRGLQTTRGEMDNIGMSKVVEFPKSYNTPPDQEPAPVTAAKPSGRPKTEDPINALLRQLKEYGRLAAVSGGDVIPDPNRMAALEEYARGQAFALYGPAFDPERNPEDRRLQETQEVLSPQQRFHANEALRLIGVRREARRQVPAPEDPPRVSRPLFLFAITGFALGFGASLEPLFAQSIDDAPLAWFAALAIGAAIGGLVTWGLFGITEEGGGDDEEQD